MRLRGWACVSAAIRPVVVVEKTYVGHFVLLVNGKMNFTTIEFPIRNNPMMLLYFRVPEFLRNMMMFDMMGFGMGTPAIFRIINPDPHAFPGRRPFPAQPIPVDT